MNQGMVEQRIREFSQEENKVWHDLYVNLKDNRKTQAISEFQVGLNALKITADQIPDLDKTNKKLKDLTGWMGVPVEGLVDGAGFFKALSERKFPIGNFIRSPAVSSYTPAPDIFHDLYGHIPFYVDKDYADFSYSIGVAALEFANQPEKLVQFERFFWFTIEFGLIESLEESAGRRIFGAGLLSSFSESNYALSAAPLVLPFDIPTICRQDFRIDVFQNKLFIIKSRAQLYLSLPELVNFVRAN
jgi:phenylalanine-4-hydroxylase